MSDLTRAVLLALALAIAPGARAQHATAETLAKRSLPDWVDTLLRQLDTHQLEWESVSLTIPEDPDAPKDRAHVEIFSPEKFSRLSHMLVFSPGPSDLKNVSTETRRRSQVLYPVQIEQPTIREADVATLPDPAHEIASLAEHLDTPGLRLEQLLASRPVALSLFEKPAQRIPVRFVLVGPRDRVLTRLAELARALPRSYLRSVRVTRSGSDLALAASVNLLVKPAARPEPTTAAEAQRVAAEKLAAAGGAGVHVSGSSPADSATVILALKGTVADPAAARAVLKEAVALPGLKAYDELGWRHHEKVEVTGLLHF